MKVKVKHRYIEFGGIWSTSSSKICRKYSFFSCKAKDLKTACSIHAQKSFEQFYFLRLRRSDESRQFWEKNDSGGGFGRGEEMKEDEIEACFCITAH
nr:hypothetical protein Iba_chr02cCG10230 [Ipomoea batatas]